MEEGRRADLAEAGRKARELCSLVVPDQLGDLNVHRRKKSEPPGTSPQPSQESPWQWRSLAQDCPGSQEVDRTQGIQNPAQGRSDIDRVMGDSE